MNSLIRLMNLQRKIVLYCLALLASAHAYADSPVNPKFSDYPAEIYSGEWTPPSFIKMEDDIWRDEMGKMVAPLSINTAGKFYMALHSCGTSCRYYTLTDLSSGEQSQALDAFSSQNTTSKNPNKGIITINEIITRPESFLLLIRSYNESADNQYSNCLARYFVLSKDGKLIKSITKPLKCQIN